MSTSKHPLPIFSRETRLGLVLYGGVSLAIYMNGICQEFYNAVRGRGIYKLIKALTDSDIVVDIVSGTSAGGVNGVLLSYAIANSSQDAVVDFKNFANLWIDNADIEKLLRKNVRGKDKPLFNSVLDGEGFYQAKLEEAFQKEAIRHPEKNDWYSEFSELDLFITATDLDGRINQVPDNTGKLIEIKDHRAVFHLKYRQDQIEYIDNPFKPERATREALAKLCRITSCFPVAFPVVKVKLYPEDVDEVDSKLVNWGKLQNRELEDSHQEREDNYKKQEYFLYFVDGGVLNNRPFSSTVQTIYARSAYRPTKRQLFYIDPNPEKFLDNTNDEKDLKFSAGQDRWKDPLKVGLASKIDIPNYQSISKDLDYIKEGNRKVIRYQLLRKSLEDKTANQLRKFISLHEENEEHKYDNVEYANYLKCRFLGLLDNSIQQILISSGKKSVTQQKILQEAAELLTNELLSKKTKEYLQNLYQQIAPLDIDFLIRKHCFVLGFISKITQKFQQKNNLKQYLELRYLAYQLSWQFELLKIVQKSLYQILSGYEFDEILDEGKAGESQLDRLYNFLIFFHKTLLGVRNNQKSEKENQEKSWKKLLETYYELFKVIHFPNDINFEEHPINWSDLKILLPEQESFLAKEIFTQIYQMPICNILTCDTNKDRKQKIAGFKTNITQKLAKNQDCKGQEEEQETVLDIINEHSKQLIDRISIDEDEKFKLTSYFEYFEVIDKLLYPYEYLSEISTKNTIELVRISPNDANKLGFGKSQNVYTKLRGYKLGAFGGFLKKAWRSNDMLWGRLDGLDRMVNALVTPESLKNFIQFRNKYQENLNLEDLVQDSLPQATDDEREAIINYLQCISPNSTCDSPHSQKEFENFLDCVVTAGQRQILSEDLDSVLTDMNGSKGKDTRKRLELEQSKQSLNKQLDDKFKEYQDIKKSKSYNYLDFWIKFWIGIVVFVRVLVLRIRLPKRRRVRELSLRTKSIS
jgi:patatin-related protein